jgi:hypothetical protein
VEKNNHNLLAYMSHVSPFLCLFLSFPRERERERERGKTVKSNNRTEKTGKQYVTHSIKFPSGSLQ